MKEINIVVVGLGGVGNVVADALYPFLRALVCDTQLKRIVFVDKDRYEESNFPRQKAAGAMMGEIKSEAWQRIYGKSKYNMMGTVAEAVADWVTPSNISAIFDGICSERATIIMACVDNHPARLLISKYVQDRIKKLSDLVVIQGGCSHNRATTDMFGKWNGVVVGTPIEVNHPEVEQSSNGDRSRISCEELANSPTGDQTYVENFMAGSMMMMLMFTLLISPKGLVSLIEEFYDISDHYYLINRRRPAPPPGYVPGGARPAAGGSVDGEPSASTPSAPAFTDAQTHAIEAVLPHHAAMPLVACILHTSNSGGLECITSPDNVGAFLMSLRGFNLSQEVVSKGLAAFNKDGEALWNAAKQAVECISVMPGNNWHEKIHTLAEACYHKDPYSDGAKDFLLAGKICPFNGRSPESDGLYQQYAQRGAFDYACLTGGKDAAKAPELSYEVKSDDTSKNRRNPDDVDAPAPVEGDEQIALPGEYMPDEIPRVATDEEINAMSEAELAATISALGRVTMRRREEERRARRARQEAEASAASASSGSN